MIILFILWVFLVILTFTLSLFYLLPFLFGAPYEKSKEGPIKSIKEFSGDSKHVAELGVGSGEIAIALAKEGIKVDGYEINPLLALYVKRKIKKLNLEEKIKIIWGNFFNYPLKKYDTIVLFQFPTITEKLSKKFHKELIKGTKIISNYWELPNMKIKKENKKVFLYEI